MSNRQSLSEGHEGPQKKKLTPLPIDLKIQHYPKLPGETESIPKDTTDLKDLSQKMEKLRATPKHLLPPLIVIKFPHDKFNEYLKGIGVSSFEDLQISQIEAIFVASIGDYKIGKLSTDELAAIGANLWTLGMRKFKGFFDTKLGEALHAAEELAFYLRIITTDKEEKIGELQFLGFLRDVLSFAKDRQVKGGD